MIHVFTSAAVNYLPKVRVLCKSLRRYHPEFVIHLALADKIPEWLDLHQEPFDHVVGVEELDVKNRASWIFRHSLVELSTAIKPFVLRKILAQRKCDAVLYVDPDIVFFSRIDDLLKRLRKSNIVLTPHQTKPETDMQAVIDNEVCSLSHGIYNLGFIGVRNTIVGRDFAEWWAERLYHFCWAEPEIGLFTDQKWVNLAPVYFDGVDILKSSRFNVAPWNLTTRKVTGNVKSGFKVDGKPLGFYHFTGFDSGNHAIMAEKNGRSNRAVRKLIRLYAEWTSVGRNGAESNLPWAFSCFENGQRISPEHRRIYRERIDLQGAFPNPFAVHSNGDSYFDWFREQAPREFPERDLAKTFAPKILVTDKRWVLRKTLEILKKEQIGA